MYTLTISGNRAKYYPNSSQKSSKTNQKSSETNSNEMLNREHLMQRIR